MARLIEFSRRSTSQLQKILTFYDERNDSDAYSRRLLSCLLEDISQLAINPTASSPSTRPDVRFFYLMGFTIVFRYNSRRITILSIRSSLRKPLKIYKKE
jgi:plasmid stabilization system protein ParE